MGEEGKGKDGGNFPNIFSLFPPPPETFTFVRIPSAASYFPSSPEPAPDAKKKKAKPPGF